MCRSVHKNSDASLKVISSWIYGAMHRIIYVCL